MREQGGFSFGMDFPCPKCREQFKESQVALDTTMQNVLEQLTFACDFEECQVFFHLHCVAKALAVVLTSLCMRRQTSHNFQIDAKNI